ncbi:ribonuclease H-like domain-containing protein [Tanacetum coccineum]|uniref:Ribonuclease H-like domain-containing protein n=1 Tax=Tanacetum coccineum TaxID=301880 RepID=A0ABQ4XD46_9ASTR
MSERQMQSRESKDVLSKALDDSLVVTECSRTKYKPVMDPNAICAEVEVHLTTQHNVLANVQQHTNQSEPSYDTYLLEKVDSNTTPDSTNMCHRGGEIDQDAEHDQVKSPLLTAEFLKRNDMVEKEVYNELSNRFLQLEKHCISLEISMQQKEESFQSNKPCKNQESPEFHEFFKINDLKAQLQAKTTLICNLKEFKFKCVKEPSQLMNPSSSGTKIYRGSNSSDGGNTEDGVKITGEVIGSGRLYSRSLVQRCLNIDMSLIGKFGIMVITVPGHHNSEVQIAIVGLSLVLLSLKMVFDGEIRYLIRSLYRSLCRGGLISLLLKRILRYVQGTLNYGLQLFSSSTSDLVAYSDDADWAGCPTTRRSTSGYCVFPGNNLLSWSAKRQPTLSRFCAEAEYRGVANAVAETCWLMNLLPELHTPLSSATLVYCDNVQCVIYHEILLFTSGTKHIEIDIHFVCDLVAAGQVRVHHVPSRYQFADIFTKGLPSALFKEFRSSLSVRCPPTPTAGEC